MKNKQQNRRLLLVIPLIFLALFYFYPLIKIFLVSFFPSGAWNPDKLRQLFSSGIYGRIIWFTTWQALLSTILTLLFALPGSYIFARYNFIGKKILQALMTIPFVLPTVVTAAAFRALLGHNGLLNSWLINIFNLDTQPIQINQTICFFLLAHIFYNYTLVLRIVGNFWAGINPNIRAAATMLGASPSKTFFKITLPLLMPAIGSAAILVFIFCFTSFGVILILGGPGHATIEVEIYRQAVQFFNLPMAAILSLIQIIINFFLMWLHARLTEKSKIPFFGDSADHTAIRAKNSWQQAAIFINILFMTILLITPLLALFIKSLSSSDGPTLSYYYALFTPQLDSVFSVPPIIAIRNSVAFGLTTMLLSVTLGILAATYLAADNHRNKSLWDALIMLPLATSAVTLGFGYIITLNTPPLNLRNSLALIPIAHSLVAFPFVIRCILPGLKQIPSNLGEAATMLGASPFRVWYYVDLPMIKKSVIVGGIFAFAISMGEFGASTFVTRPHTATMPVAIFRFLSQPGELNYGQAMAMSSILMLVTSLAFLLIGRMDFSETG